MDYVISTGLIILLLLFIAFLLQFKIVIKLISFVRIILIGLMFLFYSTMLIALHSLIAGVLIIFSIDNKFFLLNGNPITFVDEAALLQTSITFGIVYYILFILSTIIYSFIRLNQWAYIGLVYITIITAHTLFYPVIVQSLFNDITISIVGSLYLNISVLITIIFEIIRNKNKERKKAYRYNREIDKDHFVRRHLFPWIENRKVPIE